jgi:hypothetical protein
VLHRQVVVEDHLLAAIGGTPPLHQHLFGDVSGGDRAFQLKFIFN